MTGRYDYYLVENTYVARYDRDAGRAERLLPDGTWARSMATREIFDGRPLEDERDALDTAAFLVARDRERAARRS
jgi:hypothetical protein